MTPVQVAVVAPAAAVRLGLHSLLSASPDVEVNAEVASLEELASLRMPARVLVLALHPQNFSQALPQLQQGEPLPVLLLVSGEAPSLEELTSLSNRAWGLLPLEASAEEILAAVRALDEGLYVGAPELLVPLLSRSSFGQPTEEEPMSPSMADIVGTQVLTEREAQVLQLLAQGLANKQIAAHLGISEHTVKFHVSAIYAKLGASSRTEAVRLGVRRGLILL